MSILALNLAASLAVASLARTASAATIDWTGGTSTDWATASNWNSGSGPVPGSLDTATFAGSSYTHQPSISAAQSVNGLDFSGSAAVTISGSGTLTIGSSGVTDTASADATLSVPIFDGGQGYGLEENGSASLILGSGAGGSNFTGTVTITAGTISVESAAITTRDNVIDMDAFVGTQTLCLGGSAATFAGLNGGLGATIFTSNCVRFGGTGSYGFNGVIAGSGSLDKFGVGTQILGNLGFTSPDQSTYTGATVVGGGTLQLDFPVGFQSDLLYGYSGTINKPAGPLQLAGGTLTFGVAAVGFTTQHFGSISVQPGGSAITMSVGHMMDLTLSTGNITRSANGATVNFHITNGPGGMPGTPGPAAVATTASDDGTGILGAYATFTDGTTGATDWAATPSATQHVAAAAMGSMTGTAGTWDRTGGVIDVYYSGGSYSVDDPVSFNGTNDSLPGGITAGTLYYVEALGNGGGKTWFNISAWPTTMDLPISAIAGTGSSGTLSIDSQGEIGAYSSYTAFSGAAYTDNATLTGTTSLIANKSVNTLKVTTSGSSQSLDLAGYTLTFAGGGLLFTGADDYTIGVTSGSALTSGSGEVIVQQFGAGNLTISAKITGSIDLTKSGPGTLTLTGSNDFSGDVYLNTGITNINSLQALGDGSSITFSGGTLQYAASTTADITKTTGGGTRTVTLAGNGGTIDTNGNNVTFANPLTGIGGLTKVGAGTLTLESNNSYQGPTTIIGGILSLGASTTLKNGNVAGDVTTTSAIGMSGYAADNIVLDGGTLQYLGGTASTDRNFTVTLNGGTIDASGTGTLTFTNTSPIALSGTGTHTLTLTGSNTGDNTLSLALNDSGGDSSLLKSGAGTWILAAANGYSGGTTITGGILSISSDGNLGTSLSSPTPGNIVLDGGALLASTDITLNPNRGIALGPVSGSGSGTLDAATSKTLTYNGIIADNTSGTGSLIKGSGTGTVVLGGSNTYSGSTTISGGTLKIAAAGALPTNGNVVNNAAFDVAADTTAGTITGTGGTTVESGVTLTLAGSTVNSSDPRNPDATTSVFGSLSIDGGSTPDATLNLNNNILIISNGGTSARDTVEAQVDKARNGGLWNQPGITSSDAQAAFSATGFDMETIGVALNSELTYPYSTFGGVSVSSNDVLVMFTYGGDADLSGTVNSNDYFHIDVGFASGLTGWFNGDFNYDGVINGNDYFIIDSTFIDQSGQLAASEILEHAAEFGPAYLSQFSPAQLAAIGVPEPASLALLGAGTLALFGRGGRRRRSLRE